MTDRAIGIILGVLIGLAIVIGFVFLGSGDTIDDPGLSGGGGEAERTAPAQPSQPQAGQPEEPSP
jgi:hypothetical protein